MNREQKLGSTTYLPTNFMSSLVNHSVILSNKKICKVDLKDYQGLIFQERSVLVNSLTLSI